MLITPLVLLPLKFGFSWLDDISFGVGLCPFHIPPQQPALNQSPLLIIPNECAKEQACQAHCFDLEFIGICKPECFLQLWL